MYDILHFFDRTRRLLFSLLVFVRLQFEGNYYLRVVLFEKPVDIIDGWRRYVHTNDTVMTVRCYRLAHAASQSSCQPWK